jgi:hypothetical protein
MDSFDTKANGLSNELKARIGLARSFGKAGRQLKKYFKEHPAPKKNAKTSALKARC